MPVPSPHETTHNDQIKGAALVLCSLITQNVGATCAKHLFIAIGAAGVAALRIGLAALILMAFRRPWRRGFPLESWKPLILYGAGLGLMNLLFYQAFARIPIGLAIAIEVAGPVLISLLGSRTLKDFLWIGLIITGLAFLLPCMQAIILILLACFLQPVPDSAGCFTFCSENPSPPVWDWMPPHGV